jgi:hypothetical protein
MHETASNQDEGREYRTRVRTYERMTRQEIALAQSIARGALPAEIVHYTALYEGAVSDYQNCPRRSNPLAQRAIPREPGEFPA